MGYKDHMYALSSKSGSEPFRFALFLGDLRWNDPEGYLHTKKWLKIHCQILQMKKVLWGLLAD